MELTHFQTFYYAFLEGLTGGFNPCGFAMFPVFLSILVHSQLSVMLTHTPLFLAYRSFTAACLAATGFSAVFGLFNFVQMPFLLRIARYLPWVSAGAGLLIVAIGVAQVVRNVQETPRVMSLSQPRSAVSLVWALCALLFGAAHAVISLSYGPGTTDTVIRWSRQAGAFHVGFLSCIFFAIGMTIVLGSLAVFVSLSHTVISTLVPAFQRTGGVLISLLTVLLGTFITYHGWYSGLSDTHAITNNEFMNRALGAQQWVIYAISAISPWQWTFLLGTLGILSLLWTVCVGLWNPYLPPTQSSQ